MINEITYLRRMIYLYKYHDSNKEFLKAKAHLNKVYKQYGTIDVSAIQNLIK